jgi:hypothetical protein
LKDTKGNAMTDKQTQDLVRLLKTAQQLGLRFDIGNAYIRRSYIDKQAQLNKEIDALLEAVDNLN